MLRKFKGQSTLEYALIVAVVVAGLIAMQIYMKRGVQGKLRESTDQIGEQFDAENTTMSRTTTRIGTTVQEVKAGVTTSTTDAATPEKRTETGTEEVAAWKTTP